MHILASRRNDAEADWAEGRNEAEAADAAAETRREADSDDARIEADAIEAEQAEQSKMKSTFQIGETLRLRNPSLAGTAHAEVAVTFRGRIDPDRSVVSPVQPGMDFEATTAHLSSVKSNAGPEPLFLEDLLVQIETIIDTAATGPEVHADRQADFFALIEHQARAARATLVAETDLLPPSDDREQFGDVDEFH